jgi:hypothetical protein
MACGLFPIRMRFVRTMMESSNRSPQIKNVSWGRLEIEGRAESYKDAMLFPGGSRDWNWRETKTSHRPGIQIADVQALAYKRNAFGL